MDVPRAARLTDGQALAEHLRAAGLRVTRPRLLVLRFLGEVGGHRSVDEIRAGLRARGVALPRASLYNVVSDLAGRGLLVMTDIGPGRARFEWPERQHHHFVCRECGAILDVPCVVGRRPCLAPAGDVGLVDGAQIIFRGRCRACVAKARAGRRRAAPR